MSAKRKNGMVTFYINPKSDPGFNEVFNKFIDLIEKDDTIKEQRHKRGDGLLSIAIRQLIKDYVAIQNAGESNEN